MAFAGMGKKMVKTMACSFRSTFAKVLASILILVVANVHAVLEEVDAIAAIVDQRCTPRRAKFEL